MDRTLAVTAALSKTLEPVSARHRPALHKIALALIGMIAAAGAASPAMAGSEASTKVVRCGAQSCLQVSGHRDDPDAVVSINGQEVPVEGKNGWRVRLPVETVRQWSAPYARTIEVSLSDPASQVESTASVDLPIGLLGNVTELASLEIRVR